jgi:TonB-dependent SusC/RagA subfamily outer membrane receptor
MKYLLTIPAFFFSIMVCFAKDDGATVSSKLTTVTVYRSGAEMVHTANANLKQGNNQLIVEGISNKIDINSIQVKTPAAVTVLGVEFSNNYLPPSEKTARETMLDDSLEHLQQDEDKINLSITNTTDLLDVLKENRNIKGTQNGLSVAELTKLMDYYKGKSLELQTELQQLKGQKKRLDGLVQKIRDQIDEEQKKNISTAGRLTLQLSAAVEGRCDLTVTYIAQNASWSPCYDVRVQNTNSPLKLVYKAKVEQTTGIDWKQVKLALSTSTPAQWGNAPLLNAWFLAYINPVNVMNRDLASLNTIQPFAKYSTLNDVVVTGFGTKSTYRAMAGSNDNNKPLYVVNGSPMSSEEFAKINPDDIKKMDVLKGDAAAAIYGSEAANGAVVVELKNGLEDYISVASNVLDMTYNLDVPYDIPTNGKEQTATLKTTDVPCNYKDYAVPKLDKDAYLLAEIPNWDKLNLLPGEANIILENTYVGKSFIDPASTSDTLNLTLGRDQRVAVKREKVVDYSSVKFLGSNKLQKFTYVITVKNNKTEAVNLLLKDQFPLSTNKDIDVNLEDNGGAEVNNELGVLNWKITLAPGESKKLTFAYSIKYPKDKTLNLN